MMEGLKPCPFCGKPLYIKVKQYSKPILVPLTRAGALRDELIDITGENYVPVEAKYCPVCGRPLGRRVALENKPLTCEGCKHISTVHFEYPCDSCMRLRVDRYEREGN